MLRMWRGSYERVHWLALCNHQSVYFLPLKSKRWHKEPKKILKCIAFKHNRNKTKTIITSELYPQNIGLFLNICIAYCMTCNRTTDKVNTDRSENNRIGNNFLWSTVNKPIWLDKTGEFIAQTVYNIILYKKHISEIWIQKNSLNYIKSGKLIC